MKNALFILCLIFSGTLAAQSSFGVKAGLNYADNGKVEYSDFSNASEDIMEAKAERKTGYHFGVFYRADFGMFYLKPELLYTTSTSSYDYNSKSSEFSTSSLDLPVLLGVNVLGPLDIFVGPSFQYVMSNDFEGVTLEELKNEFTVGAQFGVGVQFGGIGIDARYAQALSEKHAALIGIGGENGEKRLDSRPNQFILSLSLDL